MKKGIEYADKSWNPYSGCLAVHNDNTCAVGKNCWAYKMSLRHAGRFGYPPRPYNFNPTFHIDKLTVPIRRKKPTRWDSCFMGDIAYAKREWLIQIMIIVRKCPQHRFYFLTKQPDLLAKMDISFPDNAWLGVTVNREADLWRIDQLLEIQACHIWTSFEPTYEEINPSLAGLDWIVIGAQSNPEVQPEKKWVEDIIKIADNLDIPVFIKPNLTVVDPRMELPEELEGF